MKITMIGTSGSGKTVFSTGVYAKLMRRDYNKFEIIPAADNFSRELLETHKFAKDYKMIVNRKWPDGTTGTSYYSLNLFYNGVYITDFDWIDYRGGFLDDPEIDPRQAEEVHANVAASDAVILFADAQKLTYYDDIDEARYRSGAEAVMSILTSYSRNYPDNKLSFVIALTKCDAVSSSYIGSVEDYRPLVKRGLEAFSPLKTVLARERNWRGGIVPVSTLGLGNVDNSGNITGFLKPYNIENVLFYCIGSTLRYYREDFINDIMLREDAASKIKEKYKGFLGTLRKTFLQLGRSYTDGDVLESHKKAQRESYNALKRIQPYIEPLERIALEQLTVIS